MRRSPRKIIAWLLLIFISLNPALGALAIDVEAAQEMGNCEIVMAAGASLGPADHAGAGTMTDCAQQHHACTAFCQFSSLQPFDPPRMGTSRLLWFELSGEPDNLVSRFLDSLERPPRA